MKKIYEPVKIKKYLEKYHIQDYFENTYSFYLIEYAKDETIIHPLKDTNEIQFVVEGEISIYSIDSNGKQIYVAQTNNSCLLGDVEFIRHEKPIYFAQADTKVITIALSIQENKSKLNQDILFLHYLMNCLVDKLHNKSADEIMNPSVEERVLNYMRFQPLTNISLTCRNLHCSRRQLQRVLKKLCQQGKIEKVEKGKYVLQLSMSLEDYK